MMRDPIGDPAMRVSLNDGTGSALYLPGRGFSLWLRCHRLGTVRNSSTQASAVARGFSLPDPNRRHLANQPSTCLQRGFSRNRQATLAHSISNSPPIADRVPAETLLPLSTTPLPSTVQLPPPNASLSLASEYTMNSPTKLPANGFSVWTKRSLPSVALTLAEPSMQANLTLASSAPELKVAETATKVHAFESSASATEPKRHLSLYRWVAALLIGLLLVAFLSTEGKLQERVVEVQTLTGINDALEIEKTKNYDNWKLEEQRSAALEDTIAGLEKNLSDSKANIVQLNAQKEGLSKTIDGLRNALAMTIEEMKNTEASLNKVIASLEASNKEIAQKLALETSKLESLGAELADVRSQLDAQKATNEKLVADNKELSDKVAQLQSSLNQTLRDTEAREKAMRDQIGTLEKANQELASSLEVQKAELDAVKDKLEASEAEAVLSEKEEELRQSQLEDLNRKLDEAVASRNALQNEKQALSQSVEQLNQQLEHQKTGPSSETLQKEINSLKTKNSDSGAQIKALEKHRDSLLHRNEELQSSVQQLNGKLSDLAEKEEVVESKLSERIKELIGDNEQLKSSLEIQRNEFKALLKQGRTDKKSASSDEVSGALKDLKETLSQSVHHGRETGNLLREQTKHFSTTFVAQTNRIQGLNTRIAEADRKIATSRSVLAELETLRQQVKALRTQGGQLEDELAQRVVQISTLNASKNTWKEESLKLRSLLESESAAQAKLASFVEALQERIGDLEDSSAVTSEVAAK